MANSGSVFSETLHNITATKLEELANRRTTFENAKATALSSADVARDDHAQRLESLSTGVKQGFGIQTDKAGAVILNRSKHRQLEIELKNLGRFMAQARHDPSVSPEMMKGWEEMLRRHLETQSNKYQYADLYGKLVTEWLNAGLPAKKGSEDGDEDFEHVSNALKLEGRMEWEKMVFTPASVDEAGLGKFLSDLFGVDAAKDSPKSKVHDALEGMRKYIESPDDIAGLFTDCFNEDTLKWAIDGLLASKLLPDEKREVLRDFRGSRTILNEIADVLNMRMAAIDSWSWGDHVPVEQTRKISGIYDITMHEDVLQALFLQYIGVKWSVIFKKAFARFYCHGFGEAWPRMGERVPCERERHVHKYIGWNLDRNGNLSTKRQKLHRRDYFVSQLLNIEKQEYEATKDGEEEAQYREFNIMDLPDPAAPAAPAAKQMGADTRVYRKKVRQETPHRPEPDIDSDENGPRKRSPPIHLKRSLLHMMSSEIAINTKTKGEITLFHSVLENWNSRLPHESLLAILKFLGVSPTWIAFFTKFLSAPLRFVEDDATTAPRIRRRGTPDAHALSEVFGEVFLFCLDFTVVQATGGQPLWRVEDDIWFWSSDHGMAVGAWKALTDFVAVTGTLVDSRKSESVRVVGDGSGEPHPAIDPSLPRGQIRWGFLCLNASSGRFEIDQAMVDKHIEEMRKQLREKSGSVLGFIQAWNSYAARFFSSNFGKAANCFGRDHVDEMLATHRRIQKVVFATADGDEASGATSVVDFLKKTIRHRFGVENLPDGYFFFPVELGGLDLHSPFIPLQLVRDATIESPSERLAKVLTDEREAYKRAREYFLSGKFVALPPGPLEDDGEWKLTFEEFVQYRETFHWHSYSGAVYENLYQISDAFDDLRRQPSEENVDRGEDMLSPVNAALERLRETGSQKGGISGNWSAMEPYWQWVTMMYGPEIVSRFGGLNIVDAGLLPMGMVSIFREKRVTWNG